MTITCNSQPETYIKAALGRFRAVAEHERGIEPQSRQHAMDREEATLGVGGVDIVLTFEEAAGAPRTPLLVLRPLERFLDKRGLREGPLQVWPLGAGHSNPTYAVRRGGVELVLRRPPRPPLPASAHDVLREARVLVALDGWVPVPRVLAVCEDREVIGAPFYVMEKLDGHVLTETVPKALDSADDRRRMAEQLIDTLVELHGVDWRACGLEGFGKPTGYLERQIRRFTRSWENARTRDFPAVERLGRWLGMRLPQQNPATVVHGDYRLGNVMYGLSSPARLIAVFDWEMSTVGDPVADLGYLSAFWVEPDDPPLRMFELSAVTREPGFPSREELVARYEERSGRPVTNLSWYQTLALWKLAIAMEINYQRALEGATDDPYLGGFGGGVPELLDQAEAIARTSD